MRTVTAIGLLLITVGLSGCSKSSPTAELVTWSIVPIEGDDEGPKFFPVHVRVRATGTAIYRRDDRGKYSANCEDFILTGPNGQTSKAAAFRNMSEQFFAASATLGGRPKDQEEVEVVFAVPPEFARRDDLVLTYHDLPPLTLDPAKKKQQ